MSAILKEQEVVVSKLREDSENLQNLAKTLGYSNKEAKLLKLQKLTLFKTEEEYELQLGLKERIKLARLIPLNIFGGYAEFKALSPTQRDKRLMGLGIDVNFPVVVDLGCTTLNEKRVCEYLLTGQERTDKEWVSLMVGGKHVASWEAQLDHKADPTLRMELSKLSRGC